jgi:hypothetical protein
MEGYPLQGVIDTIPIGFCMWDYSENIYGQLVTNKRLSDAELQALTVSTALGGCPKIHSLCTQQK